MTEDQTIVLVEQHPLYDALVRSSGGWSFSSDADLRVIVAHDDGFWVRFGHTTWARIGRSTDAAAFVAKLMEEAVARGETGRHALMGEASTVHGPLGLLVFAANTRVYLERYRPAESG